MNGQELKRPSHLKTCCGRNLITLGGSKGHMCPLSQGGIYSLREIKTSKNRLWTQPSNFRWVQGAELPLASGGFAPVRNKKQKENR